MGTSTLCAHLRRVKVNRRLKELRLSAKPPISVRAMGELLHMSGSAYHAYESDLRSKEKYLRMDFARRVARILADRGVDPDDVLALAGIGIDEATTPELSAGQEKWLDLFDQLSAEQRGLLMQIARQMIAPGRPDGDAPATVHTPHRNYKADTAVAARS